MAWLHDQNRCHKSRIAQNVGGDWQADVIGIEVQRIQGTDGGVRGIQVKNIRLSTKNTTPTSTAEKNAR